MPETLIVRFVRPREGSTLEWVHDLLYRDEEVIVSAYNFTLDRPFSVAGTVVIRDGYRGILFELVQENREVVAVRTPNGRLTGYYVNVNSRPKTFDGGYEVVDWELDVWVSPDAKRCWVLDQDEFEESVRTGVLDRESAARARTVTNRTVRSVREDAFPPRIVRTLLPRFRHV